MAEIVAMDAKQIEEILFPYIEELFTVKLPQTYATSMMVDCQRVEDIVMLLPYITGGYRAAFTFTITLQAAKSQVQEAFSLQKALYDVSCLFKTETENRFPHLHITKVNPVSLYLQSAPKVVESEAEDVVKTTATYQFIYEKEGTYI